MQRLSHLYGRLLDGLLCLAALLIFMMMLMICLDVFLRNIGARGIAWSNEVSEYILYAATLLAAPWLLRRGQHIRVDIVLRALPRRIAYVLEYVSDLVGLACSVFFIWYGFRVAQDSYSSGAVSMKTLVMPEWWMLTLPPIAFLLVAGEFVFRMHRLALMPVGAREEMASAA